MKNKSKQQPKINPSKNKKVGPEQYDNFVDAVNLLQTMNCGRTIVLSTGDLNPSKLTQTDHKKHGAFYVSVTDMPEKATVFYNKKFDGGKGENQRKFYLKCQEVATQLYGSYLAPGQTISVEIMGTQNKPFNKIATNSQNISVIPHGSLALKSVPKEIYTKAGLDELCENMIIEGFVVVNQKTGDRYKLKRENFSSPTNETKQRGAHTSAPSHYTVDGITLCGGIGFSYDNAFPNMITNGILDREVTIAEMTVQGHKIELVSRPVQQVIQKQLNIPFEGDKMMNFYKTEGQGATYRYTNVPYDASIFAWDLDFQVKFDGETGLLYKDPSGIVHLMIKLQVDVYEVQKEINGPIEYRFGWY